MIATIEPFKLPLLVKFCYIEFEKAFDSINTSTCKYVTRHKRYKIEFSKTSSNIIVGGDFNTYRYR